MPDKYLYLGELFQGSEPDAIIRKSERGGTAIHTKLRFMGAARNVTGSRYLLETKSARFLVDCGLYQERRFRSRNWEPFFVPPDTLDAVLLTHAHLDHCGLLPKLAREGFRGQIYCAAATADISKIMLLDAAKIQQEDAEFKRRRHKREGRRGPFPEVPLYTTEDAESVFPLLSPVNYETPFPIADGVVASFHEAGHVLGSTMIKLVINQEGGERTIIFSGDIGGRDKPILRNPTLFPRADYVIVESTYGDRLHEDTTETGGELAEVINSTQKAGGNIVIPSFALERAQEVLYHLNQLLIKGDIPHLPTFLDSPMATNITEVFKRHSGLFDQEMSRLVRQNRSPFDFPGLKMTRSVAESKAINHVAGPAMIIAGSGMCTGGRIKHHLVNNITRQESTILFVGYQAMGTLGRHIVNGARRVRILGQHHPVRARVRQVNGFSAHADRDGLCGWLAALEEAPRRVFITHGEARTAQWFGRFLKGETGWKISVPTYGTEVTLD